MMSEDDLYTKMDRLRRQNKLKVTYANPWSKHWKRAVLFSLAFSLVCFILISSLR
jgi:hypothetical protein